MSDIEQQRALLTGRRRANGGTMLSVSTPLEMPSEPLLNCVREIVKRRVSVSAAYAFVMAVGESTPSLSIGIYFDHKPSSHEVNELFSKIGYYMRPFLSDSGHVDLLSLDATNVLAVTVKESVKPFYQRRLQ
jgi:hypothetical protein